ncbi:hypothetical protein GCM10028822_30230 [Hymenobacter terrigena]
MNETLHTLYTSWQADFENVIRQFRGIDLAGPLLMSPNALYNQQKNPLLIVGQETKGWAYLHGADMRAQMKAYETFNVAEGYYPSPFWNVTRKVEQALGNAAYSCAWTNVSKFDVAGGRAQGEQERVISSLDDLLSSEINIIKPKVCLFYTGPDFDERIEQVFPGLRYQAVDGWPERELATLVHPALPPLTFRTYHPNYLRRSSREGGFIEFMQVVGNELNA